MSENCALCGDISLSELLFLLHSEQLRINLMLSPKASKMNQRKVVNKLIIKSMSDKKGCSSKKLLSAGQIREEPISGLYRKKKKSYKMFPFPCTDRCTLNVSILRGPFFSNNSASSFSSCFTPELSLSLTVSLFFEMPKN